MAGRKKSSTFLTSNGFASFLSVVVGALAAVISTSIVKSVTCQPNLFRRTIASQRIATDSHSPAMLGIGSQARIDASPTRHGVREYFQGGTCLGIRCEGIASEESAFYL